MVPFLRTDWQTKTSFFATDLGFGSELGLISIAVS